MKRQLWVWTALLTLMCCFVYSRSGVALNREHPKVSMGIRFDNVNVRAGAAGKRAMEILLRAPERGLSDQYDSSPINIALVIDRSDSMSGEGKMDYVKDAARSIVERLNPGDGIALITYNGRAEVVIPMQEARNKRRLFDLIDSLYPLGGTNLGAGLLAGYREMDKRRRPKTINRVILLSDGLANQGITSPRELSGIAVGNYEEGVSLSTIGVGYGFNEDLMTDLATDGGGMYYYIDHPTRIPEIMAWEFSSMQCLVASNIVLRIELVGDIGIDRIIGNRYLERNGTVEYNVGELSVGERRRYMVHLDVPGLAAGKHSIGKVSMQYVVPGKGGKKVVSEPVYLVAMRDDDLIERGKNREVIERSYIFEVNEARKHAARAVDNGDMAEAVRVLTEVEKRLETAPVKTDRLAREKSYIKNYASTVKSRPRGARLRSLQKEFKHRIYALEGC